MDEVIALTRLTGDLTGVFEWEETFDWDEDIAVICLTEGLTGGLIGAFDFDERSQSLLSLLFSVSSLFSLSSQLLSSQLLSSLSNSARSIPTSDTSSDDTPSDTRCDDTPSDTPTGTSNDTPTGTSNDMVKSSDDMSSSTSFGS